MSEKKVMKPVALAVGAALAGTFALGGTVHADGADNPFEMSALSIGYMLGEGEASCGADHEGEGEGDSEGEGSCGEGSCGAEGEGEGDGDSEGEGSCGEGSCGGSV